MVFKKSGLCLVNVVLVWPGWSWKNRWSWSCNLLVLLHHWSDTIITALSSSFARNKELKKVNYHILNEFPRISPIKLHSISQTSSSSGIQAAKRKLSKVDKTMMTKNKVLS